MIGMLNPVKRFTCTLIDFILRQNSPFSVNSFYVLRQTIVLAIFFPGETENKDRLIIAEFPVSVLQLTSDASFICLWTSTIVQGNNDTKTLLIQFP